MHVDGIIFLVSVSKHIGLIQCVCICKKYRDKFLEAIMLMIRTYRARGIFKVTTNSANKTFDSIKFELQDDPYQVPLTRFYMQCRPT